MSSEQVLLVAAVLVALVALLVAVRAQRRTSHAEGALTALAERVALLESPGTSGPSVSGAQPANETASEPATYVITQLDAGRDPDRDAAPVAQPIDGRLFADIVARETVVKAASWTHGLRRALSPESRNRIRFQARQETRRAGRERRAEMKQALREYRARERDGVETLGEDVA